MHNQASNREFGFTLLEVLIAVVIMATIAVLVAGSLDSAMQSDEVNRRKSEEIRRFDRLWLLIENDFRNALGHQIKSYDGSVFPALKADDSEEYRMIFLRGGTANRLYFPRTEMSRVAYKLEDDKLWRYSWIDPANPEEDLARKQLMFADIDELEFFFLPPTAQSVDEREWIDAWPSGPQSNQLPLGIKVIVRLQNELEMMRIFSLVPGL